MPQKAFMMKRKRGQRRRIIKLAIVAVLCCLIVVLTWSTIRRQFILLNAVCKSPNCWEGITPGKTTFYEAQVILEARYGADNLESNQGYYMGWSNGFLRTSADGIVGDIRTHFAENELTVLALNDKIGEPSSVWVSRALSSEYLCSGTTILYEKRGIIAWLYPDGESIGVNQTQSVYSLEFMTLEMAENWSITDHWKLDWQGYTDYCALVGD